MFDEIEDANPTEEKNFIFEQPIKIALEQVEFRYGSFAFRYAIKEVNKELEFEIENDDIRPEFEVLKPYFSKVLNLRYISINIFAEFVNEKLVSKIAHSVDLEKLNRELIESVKFKFVTKTYFGKNPNHKFVNNLVNITHYKMGRGIVPFLIPRKNLSRMSLKIKI